MSPPWVSGLLVLLCSLHALLCDGQLGEVYTATLRTWSHWDPSASFGASIANTVFASLSLSRMCAGVNGVYMYACMWWTCDEGPA